MEARYGEFELEMQQYCLDRHMTYVPSIGLGQTLGLDPRTGEGIWARDVPATVSASGEILPDGPTFLPLVNGDFEQSLTKPVGWAVVGGNNTGTWVIDSTTSASGGRSVRLDAPANLSLSARLLSNPVPAFPNRTYQLSIFSRVSNATKLGGASAAWVWLVQLDAKGKEIQGGTHLPTGVQIGTNKYQNPKDWLEGTCTFVSDPAAAAFRVYAGHVNSVTPTTWWLDEVAILNLDSAMSNVIRTTITDYVVRPAGEPRNGSSVLKAGADYQVSAAAVNVTGSGSFRAEANSSMLNPTLLSSLRVASTSKLKAGEKLWLDYDFQVCLSVVNELVKAIAIAAFLLLVPYSF